MLLLHMPRLVFSLGVVAYPRFVIVLLEFLQRRCPNQFAVMNESIVYLYIQSSNLFPALLTREIPAPAR